MTDHIKIQGHKIWAEHKVELDQVFCWEIEKLTIWCKRTENEVQIAYKQNKDIENTEKTETTIETTYDPPEDIKWRLPGLTNRQLLPLACGNRLHLDELCRILMRYHFLFREGYFLHRVYFR